VAASFSFLFSLFYASSQPQRQQASHCALEQSRIFFAFHRPPAPFSSVLFGLIFSIWHAAHFLDAARAAQRGRRADDLKKKKTSACQMRQSALFTITCPLIDCSTCAQRHAARNAGKEPRDDSVHAELLRQQELSVHFTPSRLSMSRKHSPPSSSVIPFEADDYVFRCHIAFRLSPLSADIYCCRQRMMPCSVRPSSFQPPAISLH